MDQSPNDENNRARQILRARAAALAKPATAKSPDASAIQVIRFNLAQECYAIESQWVVEIHPFKQLTPLPCVPPFIAGITNVRGRILPVIDLKKFFNLPGQGITDLHRIILIRAEDLEFGLLADLVAGTGSLSAADIQPAPSNLSGAAAEYVKGVTGDQTIVLDAGRLVADPRLIVHDEIKA